MGLFYIATRAAKGLSHEDAEDVQSTCYEQIVRQIRHFDYDKQKGGFKAWLRTLVARRVIDLLRKHREPIADSQVLQAASDPEPAPDELWEQHWKQQHLRYSRRAGTRTSITANI